MERVDAEQNYDIAKIGHDWYYQANFSLPISLSYTFTSLGSWGWCEFSPKVVILLMQASSDLTKTTSYLDNKEML